MTAAAQRVVFVDLETGGLLAARHQVIQVAAVATMLAPPMEEVSRFEVKVQLVEGMWEQQALDVNSYDSGVWEEEALPGRQALELFTGFLREHATIERVSKERGRPYRVARLGGHNIADFDLRFLRAWYEREDQFQPSVRHCSEVVDTVHGARWLATLTGQTFESLKLESLCKAFGIPLAGNHDAKVDVLATVEVAREIARRLAAWR